MDSVCVLSDRAEIVRDHRLHKHVVVFRKRWMASEADRTMRVLYNILKKNFMKHFLCKKGTMSPRVLGE